MWSYWIAWWSHWSSWSWGARGTYITLQNDQMISNLISKGESFPPLFLSLSLSLLLFLSLPSIIHSFFFILIHSIPSLPSPFCSILPPSLSTYIYIYIYHSSSSFFLFLFSLPVLPFFRVDHRLHRLQDLPSFLDRPRK